MSTADAPTTPAAESAPAGDGGDSRKGGKSGNRRNGGNAGNGRNATRRAYLTYLAGKLGGAAISLFAILVTSFFLFRIVPGDPVKSMTHGRKVDAEQLALLRRQLGLDLPMWQQFTTYVGDALTGDLGTSYQFNEPVLDLIWERVPASLLLGGTAVLVYSILGLWLGTRSAWWHGQLGDRLNTGIALTLWSVPAFWLGMLLIIVFSVGIGPIPGMFPTGGMDSATESGFAYVVDVAHHLVLPVLTLVAVGYAQTLLVMRSSLLDEMGSDYLTTARAKGLRDDLVRRRHAVPNALLPTITLVFVNFGFIAGGSILVETVFSWPGMGGLFYQALSVPDLPLVQGLFIVYAGVMILMNVIADLIYPLFDPRVGR